MASDNFIPLDKYLLRTKEEMKTESEKFFEKLKTRRSVRTFSSETFPVEIIKNCIGSAASAPSGANKQPWHFVVVSNAGIKKKIREGAEKEEREFYQSKAPQDWLEALEPLGTDFNKPFLETAPYLVVIFEEKYQVGKDGEIVKNYYTKESVGIATGILINAIHNAGLVSLTHTPSPMNFLNEILNRPKNEKPFLILVVGFPAENTVVPNIKRKSLEEIATFL